MQFLRERTLLGSGHQTGTEKLAFQIGDRQFAVYVFELAKHAFWFSVKVVIRPGF